MALTQTEPNKNLDPVVPEPDSGNKAAHDESAKAATSIYPEPPAYFGEALEDAERLLKYAAEIGIEIDGETRDHILLARSAVSTGWDEKTAADLLSALAKIAARLKPVSAASLKAWTDNTLPTVRNYWLVAICLAAVIVPFSLASFVASAISSSIRTDISVANDLAVKLRAQLGPPPAPNQTTAPPVPAGSADPDTTVITELQQFATTIRAIDARARQLNVLVLFIERDPFAQIRKDPAALHSKFQLPSGLPNFAVAADERTMVYQDVRYFAQSLLDDVSFFYGAITACILPVLYALLGTCAYLLRTFEHQWSARTFMPSVANSARFLIAAIGGAVVGLFNNLTMGQSASIPPLATAFLVGYAVDVFFAFLEGVIQAFTKNNSVGAALSTTSSDGKP